eukprot:NODE_41_length_29768_cov_0.533924.p21 type:complete len:104 gc:universal NODE_41_length_29768_cov_0.533924:15148-14837(-)
MVVQSILLGNLHPPKLLAMLLIFIMVTSTGMVNPAMSTSTARQTVAPFTLLGLLLLTTVQSTLLGPVAHLMFRFTLLGLLRHLNQNGPTTNSALMYWISVTVH